MIKEKPKVTVLAACYNGEKFLNNYFDELLSQTYKNYEVVIVNDGSADKSIDIINKYKTIFEQQNIMFTVINKKVNEGHAKAINDGLKKVSGELLVWPDIDDCMHSDYLLNKIKAYEKNRETDIVISKCKVVNYSNKNKVLSYAWSNMEEISKEKLIKNYIKDKNVYYMSGSFMVKTETLFKIYPQREIFADVKAGPTLQLVFPIIYFGKIGYDDSCSFDYNIHGNNQHIVHAIEQLYYRNCIYENVLDNMKMPSDIKESYIKVVKEVTNNAILGQCIRDRNLSVANDVINDLKKNKNYKLKYRIKYFIIKNHIMNCVYNKIKKRVI